MLDLNISFYLIKGMIQAQFTGDKVFSNSSEAFSLYEKSRLGEKAAGRVEYSYAEVLYLVSLGKMSVFSYNKNINFDMLMVKMKKKDKKTESKFVVFSDLRKKGYILKTALKFGADYRVYEKGVKPGEDHASWILYIVKENEILIWHEFIAKNRVAHSTKKKLLLGIVDEENDVSYYEAEWKRM